MRQLTSNICFRFWLCIFLLTTSAIALGQEEEPKPADRNQTQLELDFNILDGRFSLDGSRLVVWGNKTQNQPGVRVNGSHQIAIVDLEKLKIIQQQEYLSGIRTATIDNQYVYVAPMSGNLLYRYDHNLESSKRVFTNVPIDALYALPNGKVGFPGDALGGLITVDTEKMEMDLTQPPAATKRATLRNRGVSSREVFRQFTPLPNNHVKIHQQVFDLNSGEITSANLSQLNAAFPMPRAQALLDAANTEKTFGRTINRIGILNYRNEYVHRFENTTSRSAYFWSQFSTTAPVVHVMSSQNLPRGSQITNLIFRTHQLSDGEVLYEAKFEYPAGTPVQTQCFENRIFSLLGKQISVHEIPSLAVEKVEPVLHIGVFPTQIVTTNQTLEFDIPSEGGKGKLKFQLLAEFPGLSINAQTGRISLNGKQLFQAYRNSLEQSDIFRNQQALNQFAESVKQGAKEQYEIALGKPLPETVVPMSLPICVSVTDEDEVTDVVSTFAVLLVPKNEIEDRIAKARKKFEDLNGNRLRKPRAFNPADRIVELEKRVEELEALLNSVNKQLNEANKAKAER